ncbi:MAG: HAD family phosphatase [Woeseiaceae bacterium]|nr:HAD family phosphatase [Woeseiaceae bacterium]
MNIVFDLGCVVFDWQPDALVRSVFDDPKTQALVRREIIDHPDWVELDRGTLALDQAVVRGATRTGLPDAEVARLFDAVPGSLVPIEETIDLARALRSSGHPLFVLSNMHLAGADFLETTYDIWPLFNGVVFSARIQMVKPEPGIYEHLLREHRLDPAETVFIDDLPENLEAASALGIRTIQFIDPVQCRADLANFNCL